MAHLAEDAATVLAPEIARKNYIEENYNTLEAAQTYQTSFLSLRDQYLTTPQIVSVETFAKCDAKCDFCPYVNIERINQRMPDELIAKIISDLGDLDRNVPLFITPVRINEPFLDTRIYDIVKSMSRTAPHAQFIYFSNGSPLVEQVIDRIEELPRTFCLSLSLNDHRPARYEEIMQIPYERALRRFDAVHRRKAQGRLPFWTRVTKVADNTDDDDAFIAFVKDRWPLFDIAVYRRATWSGAVETVPSVVPAVGCHQWFTVGFYADGSDPFCVMDSDGKFRHGDIRTQHLLEIYNHPFRRHLRENVLDRRTVDYCRGCPLMS
ncbi:MAG: radical SAM/SPASM domain-containing protein [Pseudomonadota bacterium]